MKEIVRTSPVSWVFGLVILAIAIANLVWVHPVPGFVFLLLSLLYFPPADIFLMKKFGFRIPLAAKIILGLVIIWFTLSVSDLGDMIDDL